MPDHVLEQRPREIFDHYCADETCQYFGQEAQQGHCFSTEPELIDWSRFEEHERQVEDELKLVRGKYSGDEYIDWLESMYVCAQLNWQGTLDEVILLRKTNRELRRKLAGNP